jgi:N-acetyl-anhydromuramyl-L-alanine amidase AmpD
MIMKSISRQLVSYFSLSLLVALVIGCSSKYHNSKGSLGSEVSIARWQDLAEQSEPPLKPLKASDIKSCMNILNVPMRNQLAHPTNYGERMQATADGKKLPTNPSLIVLHETVISAEETIRLFKENHPADNDQVSYHKLIERDGVQTTVVENSKRAFGAGMSHYGGYTLRSAKGSPGSINNIALHVSLESPRIQDSDSWHEGYSINQYKTLASTVLIWQMIYGIPMANVTTHAAVDRSHSRYDPRNFRWDIFDKYHSKYAHKCAADIFAFEASE